MSWVCKLLIAIGLWATGVVPAGASPRYVSIAPSTTEILFALGLGDRVIGVSSYCNYPPEAQNKPKIGDFSHPNLETIAAMKPDYIFCTGLEQAPAITALKRMNFRVYTADPSNINELFQTISDIGGLTGAADKAEKLIAEMRSSIDRVKAAASDIAQENKARVFIEIWHEPLMTAGKGSFIDELITIAGGINIAHDVVRPYCNYSAEKVVELNPDCIIMTYMDKEPPVRLASNRYGWKDINAVKNGRVFNDISADILLRPGPRIVIGLEEIYKRLYPGNG